jgi:predicted Co/Zn/Cd cation transporter (cation efflux family)
LVLLISAAGNLVIGLVGIFFAVLSRSQAIMLDALFNLTYFATGLFTLKVAKMVQLGDDEHFPVGYAF